MEEQTLLNAIEQLTNQKTVDGIHEVLQHYPELLTENTFLALRELATQANTRGDSEGSRFFDEMATWLQGLSEEMIAEAVANNPTVGLVQKVLAGAIPLEAALVGLQSPELIRQYGNHVLTMLDNLAWRGTEGAATVARWRPDQQVEIQARIGGRLGLIWLFLRHRRL